MNSNGHAKRNGRTDWKNDVHAFAETVVRVGNEGVRDAIAEHHRDGRPVAIWQEGRIMMLYPDGSTRPLEESPEAEADPQAA